MAAAVVTGGRVHRPGLAAVHDAGGRPAARPARPDGRRRHPRPATASPSRAPATSTAIDADLADAGELAPTVAALAALADGPSQLRGIAHIRGHETDRLAALATEINGLGGDVTETPDGLVIRPRPLRGGLFHTYGDHRLATAGALIGLRVPGVLVEDVETTAKTLPGFTGLWTAMLS